MRWQFWWSQRSPFIKELDSYENMEFHNQQAYVVLNWRASSLRHVHELELLWCIMYQEIWYDKIWYDIIWYIRRSVVHKVKRRRRTPLQAGGACEAPPHEVDTKSIWSIPKSDTDALYPRCKHRGITIKIKINSFGICDKRIPKTYQSSSSYYALFIYDRVNQGLIGVLGSTGI
jgi:hypothetical protein